MVAPESSDELVMTDEFRWNLLQKKAQEMRVVQAFELFRSKSIEPLLIKGSAAGRWYPKTKIRLSTDTDLAVSSADFDRAKEICASPAADGLAVDLHRELRHLDSVEWADLYANSESFSIDGQKVRVLRPEDHLRVMIVHWLTDGGTDRERLWDVYYAITNRPDDFDWARFLDIVPEHRRRWLICTLGLAHQFLGLDLDETPIGDEARDLPAWLLRTVEREWSAETPNIPLEVTIKDPKMFATQALKRLRPNPIWATVQMEGSFDARTRLFYQIANAFRRIVPSYRRIVHTMRLESK